MSNHQPSHGVDLPQALHELAADLHLWPDFLSLCDFGGRLAGTPGERAAQNWCCERLRTAAPWGGLRRDPTLYAGWVCDKAKLIGIASGQRLDMTPLLGAASTPAGGWALDVLDLGRGTPADIHRAGAAVRGRAVMVQHEYPFATTTVHRRVKLAAAQAAGAAAFLVAQPEKGVGVVSGSSGRAGGPGIASMGASREAADRLRHQARIHVEISGRDLPEACTDTLVLDIPGQGPERVVLSAHIDGHPLAESAIDNATGVAAALSLARTFAPWVSGCPRGLTVCIFSAEEWALQGSRNWLTAQPEAVRERMVLNVNLDSLAGSSRLTALVCGSGALADFVERAAAERDVGIHLPLMTNSDHANFAEYGIPAMRLLAGFNEPESALRLLLTPADRRDLVDAAVLRESTVTAGAIVWAALSAPASVMAALQRG